MQHASANQWLGELTDPFDRARQDYVRVVVQMFFEKGNPLVACVNRAIDKLNAVGTLDQLRSTYLSDIAFPEITQ